MNIPSYLSPIIFTIFLSLLVAIQITNHAYAENIIDLSDKTYRIWECQMSDKYFTGVVLFFFNKVNGAKLKGETTWCLAQYGENATLKGKFKKDTLKFNVLVSGSSYQCPNISGAIKFSRDPQNKMVAKGSYSSQYQRGKMTCRVSVTGRG